MRHPADLPDGSLPPDGRREPAQQPEPPGLPDAEAWARRALGTGQPPGTAHPAAAHTGGDGRGGPLRRRFARDGDVTVVVAPPGSGAGPAHRPPAAGAPPVNRLANAEAALAAEQAARHRAERALADAQSAIKRLQTQLAHAEMTGREAAETAQRADSDRLALTAALEEERAARLAAEVALFDVPLHPSRPPAAPLADAAGAPPVKRPRGRPRFVAGQPPATRGPKNQKPVRWW